MNKVIESIGGKVTTIDEYDGSEFEIMLSGPTHFSVSDACMMDGKVRNRSGTALMRLPDRRVGEAFLDAE